MDDWCKNLPPVQSLFSNNGGVESANETVSLERQLGPPFNIPRGPPEHWDPNEMIQRVRVGVMVELSTIPLYLYAMYNVNLENPQKKEAGLRARAVLRGVLQQEMLHLSFAGNLFSALGGSLDLYNPGVVPRYPGHVLMDQIPMTLRRLDAESLGHFIRIEGPDTPLLQSPIRISDKDYKSIGDLYEDVITGVRVLPDQDFAKNSDNQFTGNNFFGGQLFAITNRNTALEALRLIIEQGEGNIRVDDSHFDVFTKLHEAPNAWDVYPVPVDPQTAGYQTAPYIYKLSLAFDAAYCYLLQCIQRVWLKIENPHRNVLFRNIHALMSSVLTPLAEILIKQPWNSGVAAPCFNYYAMIGDVGGPLAPSPIPLPPGLLHRQLSNRLKDAANATSDPQQKFTLERIDRYVNENVKPSE